MQAGTRAEAEAEPEATAEPEPEADAEAEAARSWRPWSPAVAPSETGKFRPTVTGTGG
jgi:hypothetical protein